MSQSKGLLGIALFATAICVACDSPARPVQQLELQGLRQTTATDSVGTPVTSTTAETTPVYTGPPVQIRGVVRSSELKQPGPDTLVNSVRVAGVRVAAMPVTDLRTSPPTTGAVEAETTTNANGEFTLPPVAGGPYVVTFTPPAGSAYGGVWVTAMVDERTGQYPWWVTLFKR